MKRLIFSLISIFLFSLPAFASAPVCLFTDVPSGPATGGEGGNGIYLTIFGKNFGSTQGTSTVTINGKPVAQYVMWAHNYNSTAQDAIGVQVANGTTGSGSIVVTTSGGSCSNLSFTVRSGKIYFVGPAVDNSSPGSCSTLLSSNSYSSPWGLNDSSSSSEGSYSSSSMRTPYTYYNCISAGDTLVFLNGAKYAGYDGRGWHSSLTLDKSGTSSSVFTILEARPGATVKLGGIAMYGVRSTGSPSYTVYSGLTMIGAGSNGNGISTDPNDRVVGNTVNCPNCSGEQGAVFVGANNAEILGNVVTNVTASGGGATNKQYHCVYTQANNIEFGWNRMYSNQCYNGNQVNEDGTSGFYNISIHDNDISEVNGSAINLATVAPASGYVQIFNNVIHHVGIARASDGGADDPHNCVAVKGSGSASGAGTIDIWNNTFFDCSSVLNLYSSEENESGVIQIANSQTNVTTNLLNNVAYQPAYTYTGKYNVFISSDNSPGTFSGSNNIWYSASTPATTEYATSIGSVENPLLVSAADGPWSNFQLQSNSPAIDGGRQTGTVRANSGVSYTDLTWDFNGDGRPSPPAAGAFEYGSGSSSSGTGTSSGSPVATSVALSISPTAATVGQTITLTATVAKTGSTTPTGTMTFWAGSTSLGSATLNSSGTATLTVSDLAASTYSITADYGGNSSYDAANSSAVSLQVNSASSAKSTTTTLAASSTSITTGQQLTLTATVRASGATPTGSVLFHLGSSVLGTATLNQSGVATLSTSSLKAGTHYLSAKYLGTSSFKVSYSAVVLVTVTSASK